MNASLRPRAAGIGVVLFVAALSGRAAVTADQAAPAPALDRALRANKLDDARRLVPENWTAAEQLFVSYLERAYLPTNPKRPDADARARAERFAEVFFRITEYDFAKAVVSALDDADAAKRQAIVDTVRDYFVILQQQRLYFAERNRAPTGSQILAPPRPNLSADVYRLADRFRSLGLRRGELITRMALSSLITSPHPDNRTAAVIADELGDDQSLQTKRPYTDASVASAERLGLTGRLGQMLDEMGRNQLTSSEPVKLEQAARYLERARQLQRGVPAIESVKHWALPYPAPTGARLTLPALWSAYHRLNRAADAMPLIAEALAVSRPFGEQAELATIAQFASQAAALDPPAQDELLAVARGRGPRAELVVLRGTAGSGSAFRQDVAERALKTALAVPNRREQAITLEWYSRTVRGVVGIGSSSDDVARYFGERYRVLRASCVASAEIDLTAAALGSEAWVVGRSGDRARAAELYNEALTLAERAGRWLTAAHVANGAAGLSRSARFDLATRAIAAAERAGSSLELARALRNRSQAGFGATQQSLDDLLLAVAAAERNTAETSDAGEEIQCLSLLATEHRMRGEYRQAVEVHLRRLQKEQTRGAFAGGSDSYRALLDLYVRLGEPALAAEAADHLRRLLESALSSERNQANARALADASYGLARMSFALGRPSAALQYFEDALRQESAVPAASQGNMASTRNVLQERAKTYAELGDYEAALRDWDAASALPVSGSPGDQRFWRATAAARRARVHAFAGDMDQALIHAREAVELLRRSQSGAWFGLDVMNAVPNILALSGHADEAIAFITHSRETVSGENLQTPVGERFHLEALAKAYISASRLDEARAALLAAVEIDRRHPTAEVGGLAGSLLVLGMLEATAGNDAAAVEHLNAAREAADEFDLDRVWQIERALAASLARTGDRQAADAHYERALTALEAQHEQFRPEEFRFRYGEERSAIYAEHAQLLADLAIASGDPDDGVRAFQASERKRTQMLAALLATGWSRLGPEAVPDQVRRLHEMGSRMAAKRAVLREQFAQPENKRNTALLADLQRELKTLEDDHARLLSSVAQGQYRYAAPTQLSATLARQVQATLGPSRALVEYLVTDKGTYAFVVSPGGIKVVPLPIGREVLRQQVDRLTGPFQRLRAGQVDLARLDFDAGAAYALYRALFGPVRQVIGETSDVLIVPDDVLNGLPFDMLIDREPGQLERNAVLHGELADLPFLVRRYTVSYLTSSAQLLATAASVEPAPATRHLLAMANPAGSRPAPASYEDPLKRQLRSGSLSAMLDSVPGADIEVRRISRYFTTDNATVISGPAATETAYKSQAGQYRILHFATHGVPSDTQPFYSTLVLASDSAKGEDGFLQAYEILRTSLNADLVVLSACETAVGSSSDGQGLTSLVTAFQQAGARSVLATGWSIDEAASDVMDAFYRALTGGTPAPAALRQAKLELLGRRIRVAGVDVSLAHPFFWASFKLMGGGPWLPPS